MILNYTNISCRDVLRGLWFSTKISCIFSIFFCAHSVLHTKISSENSCICRSVCSAQQASRQVGKQRIRRTGRGAWGADFILRPFAATKSASKSPSMRCCVSLLFIMFPAAVFFIILRRLCFSRISRSGEIRCALGNPSAVRNVPCAAISLRAGCVVYLTVRIALRDRSV